MLAAMLQFGAFAFQDPWEMLRDFFRWLKSPAEQSEVWSDLWKTWKDADFLRQHHYDLKSGQIVLIAAVDAPFYEVKQFSMLAIGLKLAGWRPVVLTNSDRVRWAHRYFKAYGITDFIYWDEAKPSAAEYNQCELDARALMTETMTFADAKMWTYNNCWIGPQILASISRGNLQGAPDLNDPEIKRQISERLPDALQRILMAKKILDKVKPKMMLIIEANYAKYAPITDLAVHSGINVIQVTQPNRDDAFMIRRLTSTTRREHPSSLAKENYFKIRSEPWTDKKEQELAEIFAGRYGKRWFLQARNQPDVEQLGREKIFSSLELDPNKKVAIVFSHVLWDANLFYGEDLFSDYGDWFVQTVEAACKNSNVNWIIKLHPANAWKRARMKSPPELSETALIREKICTLPSHVRLLFPDAKISTKSLFEIADYGVTVRGTVSLELPCFGVPIFTAGTGRCHGMGFTNDSKTKEEYLHKMLQINKYNGLENEQINWAKHHAHAAFCRRPWFMKSYRAEFKKATSSRHMLEHNLHLAVRSINEIQLNNDLNKWADWATGNKNVDYLDY